LGRALVPPVRVGYRELEEMLDERGGDDAESLHGNGGALWGEDGDDLVHGDAGNDKLYGNGNDTLYGAGSADSTDQAESTREAFPSPRSCPRDLDRGGTARQTMYRSQPP
jgi:Ca2+-binding RTX toxin-like protein